MKWRIHQFENPIFHSHYGDCLDNALMILFLDGKWVVERQDLKNHTFRFVCYQGISYLISFAVLAGKKGID